MADERSGDKNHRFAVYAVRKKEPSPLIQTHMPFGRLMDDIVVPYESGELFFIDGAQVKAKDLDRLKIIRQIDSFDRAFRNLHVGMHRGSDLSKQELFASQYQIRLEALLRESGEDVTSQIIKAFLSTIKPKLSKYTPNKEPLLSAAAKVFGENVLLLSMNERAT